MRRPHHGRKTANRLALLVGATALTGGGLLGFSSASFAANVSCSGSHQFSNSGGIAFCYAGVGSSASATGNGGKAIAIAGGSGNTAVAVAGAGGTAVAIAGAGNR